MTIHYRGIKIFTSFHFSPYKITQQKGAVYLVSSEYTNLWLAIQKTWYPANIRITNPKP